MVELQNATPDPTGHFILEMPLSKAEQVWQALNKAGIELTPEKDLIAFNKNEEVHAYFTGRDLTYVVEAINQYQEERGKDTRINFPEVLMPLYQYHAILTFAATHCAWASYLPYYITDIYEQGWKDLQEQHPELFNQH